MGLTSDGDERGFLASAWGPRVFKGEEMRTCKESRAEAAVEAENKTREKKLLKIQCFMLHSPVG